MAERRDFLVEIGTEELPPKALRSLMEAFAEGIDAELTSQRLDHGEITSFASPRRLAVLVAELATRQEDRQAEHKGPPVSVAFDDKGRPGPAAEAFAAKCGVDVAALERRATDKGEWLFHASVEQGAATAELAAGIVSAALGRLPVPRPMRWGAGDDAFVRPVHWVVMLHGSKVVDGEVMGVAAGNRTRGHRFHAPGEITLGAPGEYAEKLRSAGFVMVDPRERLGRIRDAVSDAAQSCGGTAVADEALFEEVAALVEWPVAVVGSFDEAFLELPREVVVATLTSHQRYFPVEDPEGVLLPRFVTIANIESRKPGKVREGNERVIRPRLADAAFFWEADKALPLAARLAALDDVVYQKELGTIGDKSRRVASLAAAIAGEVGASPQAAERAGLLAKCDLLTGMVGEFSELQGTMGGYYAEVSGEPAAVAEAIAGQYLPRFAGDAIPRSATARCVSLADRLDTLCGIFATGKRPSGNKDPFGLRRSALGIARIIVEGQLDIDLKETIERAHGLQPVQDDGDTPAAVYDFIVDRLRGYALDRLGISVEIFEAVRERRPRALGDFWDRLAAVKSFVQLEPAASLAAANKRIGNILRQADHKNSVGLDEALLSEPAEKMLFAELERARADVAPLVERRAYTEALARLADLREPVDRFFDDVMVMADDEAVRRNRLSLLAQLRDQFLDVADLSRLVIT